jgi:nicotianamine synthase
LTTSAAPELLVDHGTGVRERIVGIYQRLRSLDSLAPSPVVDRLFTDLVQACVTTDPRHTATVLGDERVRALRPHLRQLCSDGETFLEKAWAREVLRSPDARLRLADFPYLANYEKLARLEVHALAASGHDLTSQPTVCFIGGGPLPLSAIFLQRLLAARVRVVDRDPEAVELSGRVLGLLLPAADAICVRRADARSVDDLAAAVDGCEVVVVAALVGTDAMDKRTVLANLGRVLQPGARLVVRSADGLRSLLYPVVDVGDVRDAGLEPEALVHPLGEVVNSVLVARRR